MRVTDPLWWYTYISNVAVVSAIVIIAIISLKRCLIALLLRTTAVICARFMRLLGLALALAVVHILIPHRSLTFGDGSLNERGSQLGRTSFLIVHCKGMV